MGTGMSTAPSRLAVWSSAVALAEAGMYQFTPLKAWCPRCRQLCAEGPHGQGEQDRGVNATGERDAQRGRSHEPGAHRLGGRREFAVERLIYQKGHVGHPNCP
jgi:hypothetical protein